MPFKSATVNSRTLLLTSVSGLRLGIAVHLTIVGSSEADDANAIRYFREAQDMQAVTKQAYGYVPNLAVLLSVVDLHQTPRELISA